MKIEITLEEARLAVRYLRRFAGQFADNTSANIDGLIAGLSKKIAEAVAARAKAREFTSLNDVLGDLKDLGNAEGVAQYLAALECRGVRGAAGANPIARLLGRLADEVVWVSEGPDGQVRAEDQFGDWGVVTLPSPAADFFCRFEAGEFPELAQ